MPEVRRGGREGKAATYTLSGNAATLRTGHHPGGQLQLLYQLVSSADGTFALSIGPRALLAPFSGGMVIGGGGGLDASARLTGWLDAVAGGFVDAVHAPTQVGVSASSTVVAPLFSLGLRARL